MANEIHGTVKPGFEALAEVFARGFADRPEMGAALHIRHQGEAIVDLWGGVADARTGRTWTQDTPTVVFSCTKGLLSILAARLVQEGKLDYSLPVAHYWPEFAAAGKDTITVGQALSHQAGLSAPRADFSEADIIDWTLATSLLASQEPLWPIAQGTYQYHALTHGWLGGEVIRRVTGKTVGELFRELITAQLGVDAWIGLPNELSDKPAHIRVSQPLLDLWAEEAKKPAPNWPYKAMTLGDALPVDLVSETGGFNAPHIRAAEIPGAGGIATAQALATMWSAVVAPTNGVKLLDDSIVASATRVQSQGQPLFGGEPPYCRWGFGFQLDSEARRYLGDGCFGHDGAGGQVGFADPTRKIGFGYITNWMMGPEDTRATEIISTLRTLV
jgi:CubicO group peptidase (beta-lactamase class C family)